MKINDEKKLSKVLGNLQTNVIKILDEFDKSEEAEALKNKVKNCNDAVELMELANQTLKFVLTWKSKYLTEKEVENIKDVCETEKERTIVRDLTDSGLTLKEILKKRAHGEVLR